MYRNAHDVAVRVFQITAVHEAEVLGWSVLGTTGGQTRLDHCVDFLPGVAGERTLDLCGGRRVGDLLIGEGGEELALQHHEVDVLVPRQAGGVIVGEEWIDGRAERGVEGLAAIEVGRRVAHEDACRHKGAPLVVDPASLILAKNKLACQ